MKKKCSGGCTGCNRGCAYAGCSACANGCNAGYGVLRGVAGPFPRPCFGWEEDAGFPYYTGPCGPCDPHSGKCCHCGCGGCTGCSGCNGCGNCGACTANANGSGCTACSGNCHHNCDQSCRCNSGSTYSETCGNTGCTHHNCDHNCGEGCSHHHGCERPCTLCETACGNTRTETCACASDCPAAASFTAGTPLELAAGECVPLKCDHYRGKDFTAGRDGICIHRAGCYMVVYTVHVPVNECMRSRFMLTLDSKCVTASMQDVAAVENGASCAYTMHALVQAESGSVLRLVSMNPVSVCGAMASNVFTLSLYRIS